MNRPPPPEDNKPVPYNAPQLVAMKKDIADRAYRIKMTGMIVSALFAVAAIATMFFLPGAGLEMARPIITLALGAGSVVTSMITMREAKKLEIDEQYLTSYMQGKNYWGEGYRKEVAEYGYGGPPLAMQAPPPNMRGKPRGPQGPFV